MTTPTVASVLEGRSREELLDRASSYRWWHAIDLGDLVTEGFHCPLIDRAFGRVDFQGKKVLDVGCWDGLWSFEAEKRGAREVYSVDYVSLRSWSEQPTYQLAHRLLGSKAKYFPNVSVYDIGRLGVKDFDIVIYCGIYYHLLDPMRAFAALREVMVEGGHIIAEGPVIDGTERVFADFYGRQWFNEDPTNWWVPTIPCLREWLDGTFFDVVSEVSPKKHIDPAPPAAAPVSGPPAPTENQDRYVIIGRASSVSERLARHVDGASAPSLDTAPDMTSEAIAGFCAAAQAFHEARPWTGLRHDVTIKVECAAVGLPLFVMVLGDGSAHRGLAIYLDRGWLTMTLQGSLPGERIVWTSFLAVLYRPESALPAGEAALLKRHGWTASTDVHPLAVINEAHNERTRELANTFRRPRADELRLLEACLRVLPGLMAKHGLTGSAREEVSASVTGGALALTVSWMTEGEQEL